MDEFYALRDIPLETLRASLQELLLIFIHFRQRIQGLLGTGWLG
jgi:hypothetical protein